MILPSLVSSETQRAIIETAKNCPPGCLVEVGVYKGGTAQALYHIAESRGLHLFDTFTGIPFKSKFDMHEKGDFGDPDLSAIRHAMPDAHIYPGIFPDTLPIVLRDIAFVHEDSDQYESTKSVIDYLYPRLVKGGVIWFDDYDTHDCPGSRKAILESGLPILRHACGKVYVRK